MEVEPRPHSSRCASRHMGECTCGEFERQSVGGSATPVPPPPTCPYCNKPLLAVRQMAMVYRQLELREGEWKQAGEVEFGYTDTDVFRHDGDGGCQVTLSWLDWHDEDEELYSEPDWLWPPAVKPSWRLP